MERGRSKWSRFLGIEASLRGVAHAGKALGTAFHPIKKDAPPRNCSVCHNRAIRDGANLILHFDFRLWQLQLYSRITGFALKSDVVVHVCSNMPFVIDLHSNSNTQMAREETKSDQLRQLAAELGELQSAIIRIADEMDRNGVPHVRLHLGTFKNVFLPNAHHWVSVAQLNSIDDSRAYLKGIETTSAIQKRYDEKRKLKNAKPEAKPAKKAKRINSKKAM